LALPVRFLTEFLIHSVGWFAQIRYGSYRVPGPPLWLSVLFFVSLICLCALLRAEFTRRRIFTLSFTALLLALTVFIATSPFPAHFTKGKVELTALDVGQGDSLLLVSPSGRTLLIDGGGESPNYGGRVSLHASDPGEKAVSPFLWSRGLKKIEVVALTHAHQDHQNNDSLVFHIQYRHRSFLLPGDAEAQAEATILSENPQSELQSDLLKVGHHGSKNSTTPKFLAAVHPQLAIISAGEQNPYGHPSRELLERLQTAGVSILRTDRNGAIHVLTDGEKLEVSCFLDCSDISSGPVHAQSQHPNPEEKKE